MGLVDKYSWVDMGSSFLPSDLNAAYLLAQLEAADTINDARLRCWNLYREGLQQLEDAGIVQLPFIPNECKHNAHMFYVMAKNLEERTALISHLKENGVQAVFHYVPLHSAAAGTKFGRFHGKDRFTTDTFNRLLRLPMYYGLTDSDVEYVCLKIREFYER